MPFRNEQIDVAVAGHLACGGTAKEDDLVRLGNGEKPVARSLRSAHC